jgi:molecular chaperone HscB
MRMPVARGASVHTGMKNHFELFGLAPGYGLDPAALDSAYREIQAQIHPDRFAAAADAERRASMQWATRVNEAYRTLRDPVRRARYLLELNGVDAALESNTAMPAEFLVQQMELREGLELAAAERDAGALERLRAGLRAQRRSLLEALAQRIDAERDFAGAADLVRKLMFLDKLDAQIDGAFEALEA